ncbi:nicotinamide mononucleotide transporter [Streptococcus dysgalactiae subsp. equisimilis]|nr:nicotinamide mononucleotide transporter [Streptococcus dysgalactiae]QJD64038.1 nicotinamide mononucleotide transporter [Streptococcus dysgalactiae subsp. equisimilis]QJR39443.1 nicotinamide riboside transporter PnuC [Streptococcus dysgalactiae subsp. equisimilis]
MAYLNYFTKTEWALWLSSVLAITKQLLWRVNDYLFMTLPMAISSLFAWLNHPFEGNKSQVTISRLESADSRRLIMFTLVVTLVFYGVLASLKTAYLLVSTLSIATSFSAVYLSYKRSPYFALAYGLNDLVLILLWMHAAQTDSSQYAVVICFATFLINDSYTFYSWLMLQRYQEKKVKKG